MPSIRFENLSDSLSRLPGVVQSIPDILRNPAANPLQAAVLLGIALIVALILVLTVFLLISRPTAEEEALLYGEWVPEGEGAEPLTEEERAEEERAEGVRRRMGRLTVTSLLIIVFVGVWVVAGVTTASPEVCISCHGKTSHTDAKNDPHAKVSCVDCHEGGGWFARVSVNVVTRVEHVVLAETNPKSAASFGVPVASDACLACHSKEIRGTYYDATLRVKISHSQPLASGAECMDCHTLDGGAVDSRTVGMSPCLRCHDGRIAKADCSACHVGDPSLAIRPSVAPNEVASVQVPTPDCGTCHKDQSKCDACHGMRMPHTREFELYGHALPAAVDLWTNHLATCRRCHFPGHQDCNQPGCHLGTFPSHGPDWRTTHATSWAQADTRCACHNWNSWDHNGMNFCQVCHPTKPAGTPP